MQGKNYKLKFTPKADEDLEQIYNYIYEKLFAENAARNLMEKIEAA
jgi:plasmid stabilization system protein ParE